MKRNNIHIVVKFFYPVAAGIETNIMETYSVLSLLGWNITLHTTTDTLTKKNVLKPKETLRGLKVRRYPWSRLGFTPAIPYEDTDLLCLHNFNLVPHFQIMLKAIWHKLTGKKKYKLVLTPHGGFNPEWSTFPLLQRIIKRLYHQTIGVWLINLSVDRVRAVSQWERKEMIAQGLRPDIITVIDNGIENMAFEDFEPQASDEIRQRVKQWGTYMLQIARIHPIKNFEVIIRAMPSLPDTLNLVLIGPVGDEAYKTSLIALAQSLKVDHRLHFAGVIRGADKYYVIKKAKIMTHMALWESYCNAVHEGMSQGLVCLVANNTALPLLIKNGVNGYCIETHDDRAFAKKVKYVLDNFKTPTIKKIQQHNRTSVREHSWENVAHRVHDLYQSLRGV